MDANGWPEPADVAAKIATIPGIVLSDAQTADLAPLIAGVVAHFQSPRGLDGSGGTGRTFTPTAGTRVFDGNGLSELFVGDIVPEGALSVSWYDAPLTGVVLKESEAGLGFNLLARSQGSGYGFLNGGVFPLGKQNIAVTALWGYARQVPDDVYEAARQEAAAQALNQAFGGISGIAKQIKTSGNDLQFDVNSSAPSQWHAAYASCVARYRESNVRRLKHLVFRMS